MNQNKTYSIHQNNDLYGQFVRLTVPLIISNILQQFYNTVDAFVIGRYAGTEEFASVGVASSIMNLFLFAAAGACGGISVLFASAYGRKDRELFRRIHFTAFYAGLFAFFLMSFAGTLFMPAILNLVNTPADLKPLVNRYLIIVLLGLPAAYLYNLLGGLLRSIGRTFISLVILAASVGLNLVLDLCLIRSLHMGVTGAALATVASQIFSSLLCIGYLILCHPECIFKKKDMVFESSLLRTVLRYSFVTGVHQCGLYIGKLLVQGTVNTGGTEIISAFTASSRIEAFINSFGDSCAAVTSILVAQNMGAGRKDRVRKTFQVSFLILSAAGLLSSGFLFLCAPRASALLLGQAQTTACMESVRYLRVIAFYYVFCFTGNTFAGFLDGIGKVHIPFIGAITHISMRVLLTAFFFPSMGLVTVSHASGLGWIYVNLLWMAIVWKMGLIHMDHSLIAKEE